MIDSGLVLWPVAGAMAAVTAVLIAWAAEATTVLRASIAVFLLAMMGAMFAGVVAYFVDPGTTGLVAALWLSSGLMSISALAVFYGYVRTLASPNAGRTARSPGYVATVIALVLGNEILMGWGFFLASGGALVGGAGPIGALANLATVVASPWFLFTMSAEMVLTTVLLRRSLPSELRALLLVQAALMFLGPTALSDPNWVTASILVGSALMIGLIILVLEHLYRHRQPNAALARYLVRLLAIYAVMMAGLFLWQTYGLVELFALSIVLEMALYFDAVLRAAAFTSGDRFAWQLSSRWTFELLSCIFVAELFMGAVIDLAVYPAAFSGAYFTLPLSGSVETVLYNAVYNGFWFLAGVTVSLGFLVMMGVEMGALVYFKYRETKSLETRIQLVLLMGCYAAFTVFFPSIYYSIVFPNWASGSSVPVLGWSMGIGSAPLAAVVFPVLLLTYVITGALVVLFGRRVICSVFCMAPLMYQGTTIDAMKSFNRSAPIARKYLSSRFSSLYSVTTGLTIGSLAVASVTSYFDTTGALNVTILGSDPTVFLLAFYFAVLWYVLFVTIPYTGNYNCVTMGWCYTGTIVQAFHKIGFSKLKVRDREVCKACTTLDCARACPVGLVDMPGHFRAKGEFRSTKCCGVGNCAGACPYGNLYLYDVRHWLRRRLGRPEVAPPRGTPLPMARPRAPTVSAAPSRGAANVRPALTSAE